MKKQSVQKSIPYRFCYRDGIIETKPGHFTRAYELKDINFAIAPMDEQRAMYEAFQKLLNLFPANMRFQVFIQNHKADKRETLKNVYYPPSRGDGLNSIRTELNNVLLDRISLGKNSIKQKKYLIISTKDEDSSHAVQVLREYDRDIDSAIREISRDVATVPCSLEERLEMIHGVYNQGADSKFGNMVDKEGNRYLDGGGVIAGDFLVVGLTEEGCRSLTEEEIEKYSEKYREAPDISQEETEADVGFTMISMI